MMNTFDVDRMEAASARQNGEHAFVRRIRGPIRDEFCDLIRRLYLSQFLAGPETRSVHPSSLWLPFRTHHLFERVQDVDQIAL